MTLTSFELLESRQLMAGISNYLDSAWAGSGVSTLAFRTFAGDASITNTQVVYAANGSTYVMARTKTTVQVQQLAGNGTPNSSFGKNGILLSPLAGQTSSAKIAADSVGNLILLADNKIYRFDGQGKSLNANFATNGVLTLGDFTGNIDMAVDAANKIYVTGKTRAGDGILVDRFISRGKRDQTFGSGGQVVVPLPRAFRNLDSPVANGKLVELIQDNTPEDTTDNDIIVAGDATAAGYDGVEFARLNYNGSFESSYGSRGIQYLLGQKSNESVRNTVDVDAIDELGRVSVTATSTDNPGLGGSITVYTAVYMANGTQLRNRHFDAGVVAPNNTEIIVEDGDLSRVQPNQAFIELNATGLIGVNDIARFGPVDDDGQSLLVTQIAKKAGRVNAVKLLPTLVPDVA